MSCGVGVSTMVVGSPSVCRILALFDYTASLFDTNSNFSCFWTNPIHHDSCATGLSGSFVSKLVPSHWHWRSRKPGGHHVGGRASEILLDGEG